jgi:hypothetical protein
MSISSIGSGTALSLGIVLAAGQAPDPQAQKAQANAQADLLNAVQGADLPMKMVLARLSDGQGIDLYL